MLRMTHATSPLRLLDWNPIVTELSVLSDTDGAVVKVTDVAGAAYVSGVYAETVKPELTPPAAVRISA